MMHVYMYYTDINLGVSASREQFEITKESRMINKRIRL